MSFLQPQILVRLKEMFSSEEDYQKRCDELLQSYGMPPGMIADGPTMQVKDCGGSFKISTSVGIVGCGNTYHFPKSKLRPDQIRQIEQLGRLSKHADR